MIKEPIVKLFLVAGVDLVFTGFTIKGVLAFNLSQLSEFSEGDSPAPFYTVSVSTVEAFKDNSVTEQAVFYIIDPDNFRKYSFKVENFHDDFTGVSLMSVTYTGAIDV